MRSPIVIEAYDPRQQLPCDQHVRGAFHPVEPFLLDNAVNPLGDRVVGRPVDDQYIDYNNIERRGRSGGSVHRTLGVTRARYPCPEPSRYWRRLGCRKGPSL